MISYGNVDSDNNDDDDGGNADEDGDDGNDNDDDDDDDDNDDDNDNDEHDGGQYVTLFYSFPATRHILVEHPYNKVHCTAMLNIMIAPHIQ